MTPLGPISFYPCDHDGTGGFGAVKVSTMQGVVTVPVCTCGVEDGSCGDIVDRALEAVTRHAASEVVAKPE